MERKRKELPLLLIYVAVGVVAAGITGWFLYQNRMEYWQPQARSAFHAALMAELQKGKPAEPHPLKEINRVFRGYILHRPKDIYFVGRWNIYPMSREVLLRVARAG